MNNINLEARETINYKEGYVAFLDILGFKKLVFSSKDEDKEKIERYLGIVDSAIEYLKNIDAKIIIDLGYIVVSDSIILSVPFGQNEEDNIKILRHLCVAIALIQRTLAIKDIWLRGAISYGNTYFDSNKNQIIGDGYINAYLLEESLAKYPRVILDNKIINLLNFTNAHQLTEEINSVKFTNWSGNILFNWEDRTFRYVEYRTFMFSSYFRKDIPLFIDYLNCPKENRETNFKMNIAENIAIYPKFKWLSEYFLLTLLEHDNNNDKLISGLINL